VIPRHAIPYLRSHRMRRMLAVAALLTAVSPGALLLSGSRASASATLDVYAVKGGGAGVRVTVQTGYSFVVEPDAMIPRAAATIEADHVDALASPLDPGDSVDALPGVGLPTAEQDIDNGAATPNPLPPPFPGSGSTPPPQFTQTVDSVVSQFASTFNPVLTVPYEHAQAGYPNPAGEPQRSTFPVGSADNVPPDFPDLFGLISAHSSSGSTTAGPGRGIADSGVGSAVSIPALGLSIGRISSHVEVHGGSGGAATSSVVTELHEVELAEPALLGLQLPPLPSGTALLHVGTMVLTATTERAPGTPHATSHTSLEASGVTVAGHSARLDEQGISLDGAPQPLLNGAAQTLVGALNSPTCTPDTPIGVPGLGSVTSQPRMQMGLPTLQSQVTHHGNEATVSMTGPTLCIATTAPIPGTDGQVAATPAVYTITLGSVTSSAYGIAFPAEGVTTLPLLPAMPETGVTGGGGTTVTNTTIDNSVSSTATTPPISPAPTGLRALLARLTGGILSRPAVVTVATLAELVLLATLWLSYRLAAAKPPDDASPASRMDLV
jgi:hypothetical protein